MISLQYLQAGLDNSWQEVLLVLDNVEQVCFRGELVVVASGTVADGDEKMNGCNWMQKVMVIFPHLRNIGEGKDNDWLHKLHEIQ